MGTNTEPFTAIVKVLDAQTERDATYQALTDVEARKHTLVERETAYVLYVDAQAALNAAWSDMNRAFLRADLSEQAQADIKDMVETYRRLMYTGQEVL